MGTLFGYDCEIDIHPTQWHGMSEMSVPREYPDETMLGEFGYFKKASGMDAVLDKARTIYNNPNANDNDKAAALQQIENLLDIDWMDAPAHVVGEAYRRTIGSSLPEDSHHVGCLVMPNGEFAGLTILPRQKPSPGDAMPTPTEYTTALVIREKDGDPWNPLLFPIENGELYDAKFTLTAPEALRDDFAGLLQGYANRVQRYITGKTFLTKTLEEQRLEIQGFITTIKSLVAPFEQRGDIQLVSSSFAANPIASENAPGTRPVPIGDSFFVVMPHIDERTEPYRSPDEISNEHALSFLLTNSRDGSAYVTPLTDVTDLIDPTTNKNTFVNPAETLEEPVDLRRLFRSAAVKSLVSQIEADLTALDEDDTTDEDVFLERHAQLTDLVNEQLPRYLWSALIDIKGVAYEVNDAIEDDSDEEPLARLPNILVTGAEYLGASIEFVDDAWKVGCTVRYPSDTWTPTNEAYVTVFVIPRRLDSFTAHPPLFSVHDTNGYSVSDRKDVSPDIFSTMNERLKSTSMAIERIYWHDAEFRLKPSSEQIEELEHACEAITAQLDDDLPAKQEVAECLLSKFVRLPKEMLGTDAVMTQPTFMIPEGDVGPNEVPAHVVRGQQACIIIPELVFGTFELTTPLRRTDFPLSHGLPMLYVETDSHVFFAPLEHVHQLTPVSTRS